jgi:hypothetical protein
VPLVIEVTLDAEGKVSGSITSAMGSGPCNGTYDKESRRLSLTFTMGPTVITIEGVIESNSIKDGTWNSGVSSGAWTASRQPGGAADAKDSDEKDAKPDDKAKSKEKDKDPIKIDFDGFETRAIQLPVSPGTFGNLAVTHDHKLLYARRSSRDGGHRNEIRDRRHRRRRRLRRWRREWSWLRRRGRLRRGHG